MASNQLTDEESKKIRRTIDTLLIRGFHFYPCPLESRLAVRHLWYSFFKPEVVAAHEKLEAVGYDTRSCTVQVVSLRWHDHHIVFRLSDHDEPGPMRLLSPLVSALKSGTPLCFEDTGISQAEFEEWVENVGRLDEEIIDARSTLDRAMALANTPGQLKRMIPGIEQYMPASVQDRMGSRASAVNIKWSARSDPMDANRLSILLAKCYLMPRTESTDEYNTVLTSKTWARRKTNGTLS